jgi:hypothetical protein
MHLKKLLAKNLIFRDLSFLEKTFSHLYSESNQKITKKAIYARGGSNIEKCI